MKHFLIIYQRSIGKLLRFEEFDDRAAATLARNAAEQEAREDTDVEVVVLSGDSRAALEQTHSRYFRTLSELVRELRDQVSQSIPSAA